MAYIPLSQQQQRLGQQRLSVAPSRVDPNKAINEAGARRMFGPQVTNLTRAIQDQQMPTRNAYQDQLQARDRLNLQQGRFVENPSMGFGRPVSNAEEIRTFDYTPEDAARDAMVRSPIRAGVKDLYRDPYEQGNLPPEFLDPITGRPPIGINDPEPQPRISYDIIGQRPPPELGVEPPAPTPQTPELTQDPGSLKLPDLSTMSPTDFTWLDNILQTVGGTIGDYFKNPMAYPAIATAFQQYKNSKTYGDDREQYRKEGNPYGPYREAAAQRLEKLYADPSSIADTPGYKFRLSQGMGNLSGKQAAAHQGWGNEFGAMQNYAQGLASTEYGNEVERLMKQAGVNIGPEASLSAQTTARGQQLQSELGALQALATPFGQNQGDARQQNPYGTIPTGGYKVSDVVNGFLKTANGTTIDYNALVRAAASGDPKAIADYQKLFLQVPPGTPSDSGYDFGGGQPIGPEVPYPDPTTPEIPIDSHVPPIEQFGPPEPDPFDPGGFDGFFDP